MGNQLFGFDTSKMDVPTPTIDRLEQEIKSTFGHHGFDASIVFSQTLER